MKHLVLLVALLATGCGTLTREHVLMPVLAVTLETVLGPAIDRELEQRTDLPAEDRAAVVIALQDLTVALASGDAGEADVIRGAWGILEPFARDAVQRRLDSGDIEEGLAGSLFETIRLFGLRVAQL